MQPKTLIKGYDRQRLRRLLILFFIALTVPTAILIRQAYTQMKWESFHLYRGQAEELTARVDSQLIEMINSADARSFADYTFLVATDDPGTNYLQRSPLANIPVVNDLPGSLGYFQVNTDGTFSTPILPPDDIVPGQLGIDSSEYAERESLAAEIKAILADNRLVQSRLDAGSRGAGLLSPEAPKAAVEEASEETAAPAGIASSSVLRESIYDDNFASASPAEKDSIDSLGAMNQAKNVNDEPYSQQAFDKLKFSRQDGEANAGALEGKEFRDSDHDVADSRARQNTIGKVDDIKLDAELQKKSEVFEQEVMKQQIADTGRKDPPARMKRREQTALPASYQPSDEIERRITTFESDIDPFDFSLLDSGHFVLYRTVWRGGERVIQGLLIEQQSFMRDVVDAKFTDTALAAMSNLVVAYQDDVIHSVRGIMHSSRYTESTESLSGALLYRNRLSAPLDSLELIFSVTRLPPGPGATVIGWVTIILIIVFLGGFFALYRLGLSQINLATQQQDFVSAVSHELKTPLTSIRMYGEMLKEGWADEDKRQSYYEFIHDESERLSRLISNVLQLAKITRNEPQFDAKPVIVSELMSNIESKITNQVNRAGFELNFERDPDADHASIAIDEDCFAQIVINLVDNAIKFSKSADNKTIDISCRLASNNNIVFSVRDYGPGIPKDQLKKIFALFYRSESELTRETVGTGIGLAIVQQLTLAMNGKVDVLNRDPGAEFTIAFPGKDL